MTNAELPRRVLRIYHAGVVDAWRAREREMIRLGLPVRLLSAAAWNEGGSLVALDTRTDQFVTGVRTFGRHPNLFVYDPIGLWRVLRAKGFDLIDVHEEPVSVAAAEVQVLAALARSRVPFALYSAQNIAKRYPVPFRWLEQIAIRRASAIHTCNDAAGRILRGKNFRGLLRNLGLGVDTDRFRPASPRAHSGRLRAGYVGRLEPRKGVHVLVDAVARVDECTLEIVGEGSQRSAIEAQIAACGASDRITLAGYVSQDELPARYQTYDLVAVPSLDTPGWVEQFGRVALEAMASGVPVIASQSGALPELIGDAGLLVSPGDVGAWAAALRRLAVEPAERRQLAACARARALHYSWFEVAGRHVELYREVLRAGR